MPKKNQATPMHIVLDTESHPSISLFWKRHGLNIMEQLAPCEFSSTTPMRSLEDSLQEAITEGGETIILLGTPDISFRGLNFFMSLTEEVRCQLKIAFWPLTPLEVNAWIFSSSKRLLTTLHVFKAENVVPMDVVQVQYRGTHLRTFYFWNSFNLTQNNLGVRTNLYIDEKSQQHHGVAFYTVSFHETLLDSLSVIPEALTRPQKLQVQLVTGTPFGMHFPSWVNRVMPSINPFYGDYLQEQGTRVEIQANGETLMLQLPGSIEMVQEVYFKVISRTLPLIVPVRPVRNLEAVRGNLLELPSRGAVATGRKSLSPSLKNPR